EPPAGLPQRLQQPAHGQAQVDGPGDQRRCRRRRPPSLDSGQGGRQLVHGQARRRAGGRRGHSGQGQRRPAEMVRLGGGQQLQRRRSFLVPAVLSHSRKQGRLQGGLIFLFRFGFYGPGRQEVPSLDAHQERRHHQIFPGFLQFHRGQLVQEVQVLLG